VATLRRCEKRGGDTASRACANNRTDWSLSTRPRPRRGSPVCAAEPSAANASMPKSRLPAGRAQRGQRVDAKVPFARWASQTFIAGLRCDGLTAPWLINGPRTRERFEAYVEHQLAPTLQPGDVVILDNLKAHDSAKARACLADRGAWFLFLPKYSPDLNPIEMAFAKMKAHLRAHEARSYDALWRAIGNICDLFTPTECWNFFKNAGYAYE